MDYEGISEKWEFVILRVHPCINKPIVKNVVRGPEPGQYVKEHNLLVFQCSVFQSTQELFKRMSFFNKMGHWEDIWS